MHGKNQNEAKGLYSAIASYSPYFSKAIEGGALCCHREEEGPAPDSWSDLHALSKLYRLLQRGSGEGAAVPLPDDLDEISRSLLRRLLDDATQQAIRSSVKVASTFPCSHSTAAPPPAAGTRRDSAGSGECKEHPRRPKSGTTESVPGRRPIRPEAAAGRRVIRGRATVPGHRGIRTVTADRRSKESGPASGLTRAGPPFDHRSKTELRLAGRSGVAEPPRSRKEIGPEGDPKKQLVIYRKGTPPIRGLSGRRDSTIRGLSSTGPSSGSGSCTADPPAPRRRLAVRREREREPAAVRKTVDPRRAPSDRRSSSSTKTKTKKKKKKSSGAEAGEKKRVGRLRRIKNGLGLIFHHHHHHHHHHHRASSSGADGGGADREHGAERRRRHHRSLKELLRGLLHHSAEKRAEAPLLPSSRPARQHGHLHAMVEGLLRHVLRLRRRKDKPRLPKPRGGGGAKKLHWWQKLRRRRRGVRLASRRKSRLRLGIGGRRKKVKNQK